MSCLDNKELIAAQSCAMAPSILNVSNDIRYIMPYWILYRNEQQFQEFKTIYEQRPRTKTTGTSELLGGNATEIQTWQVPSSSSKEIYNVTCNQGNWLCSCKGFGFRRACGHIDKIKAENKTS